MSHSTFMSVHLSVRVRGAFVGPQKQDTLEFEINPITKTILQPISVRMGQISTSN